jgi:hypothetical protein
LALANAKMPGILEFAAELDPAEIESVARRRGLSWSGMRSGQYDELRHDILLELWDRR